MQGCVTVFTTKNRLDKKMLDSRNAPYAALLLRITMGAMFLAHASLKKFVFTPAGTAGFFGSIGLPGWLAYIVILMEVVGGIALIVGVWPRIVALAMIPILLGTIYAIHVAAGYYFDGPTDGWEFPAFWIVGLVALALLGDGPYALRPTPAHNEV
jgi:putative oxidoreductase